MSAIPDMTLGPDGGEDMAMVVPATAQITVADVVGVAWEPLNDGGVPVGYPTVPTGVPTHSMAAVVDFPSAAGSAQHSNGTPLNGCTWNRYNVLPGGPGPFPVPNENAGSVNVTGYDTANSLAVDTVNLSAAPPNPNINCKFNSTTGHFDCFYGTDPTHLTDRFIFPLTPNPSPSPSPAPQAFNTDLFVNANEVTIAFTPSPAPNTYTDARMTTLTNLPKAPHVIAINGTASTTELEALETTKIDGAADVTIDFSCDGTATKGSGCSIGGITGLLIQTSLGKKWESFSGANLLRFGTMQCVMADDGTATHTFTLTKQMQLDILGSDTKQTIRVVMVRLKANATSSGQHPFYETAGRGIFSFIDQ
jgi:hypothetical protein